MMKWFLFLIVLVIVVFLLRLGELSTQVPRYKGYWHRNNQDTLSASRVDDVRYYVLGDSTAQGIGASSPKNSYPALVSDALNKKYGSVELINLSKSGAVINDVLTEQVPVMKSLGVKKNDVVTLSVGANDMASFGEEKFEADMDKLMSELPKQTIIADIPSFAGGRHSGLEKNVLEANEIVVRLCDKYGLKRALVYDKVSANHGWSTTAADFFHPSDKGYEQNWAPAFVEQL